MKSNTKTIVTKEQIQEIISYHFGESTRVNYVEELTDGWFNAVYMINLEGEGVLGNKDMVLKTGIETGKYTIRYEKDIMKTELSIYDMLWETDIPVPQILARDSSKSIINCEYFIMERVLVDNWMNFEQMISKENHDKLLGDMAEYVGKLHRIKGNYFGYIKDDTSFHHKDWRSAFTAMVHMMVEDGKKDGIDLPYNIILEAFEKVWYILDEVKEASLVNFDLWSKNVMLGYKDGEFFISALIDHERAFYGDPHADFNAMNELCTDVSTSKIFKERYSKGKGEEFTYTLNDRIRLCMYKVYLSLLMGVEVYRYDEVDRREMLDYCHKEIQKDLIELNQLIVDKNN